MSDSKINLKVGNIEFSGEGNSDWLDAQLEKFYEKVPELLKTEGSKTIIDSPSTINETDYELPSTLSLYLRSKEATVSQVRKFLVTATYLQLNGKKELTTSDITTALRESQQSRLGNASDSLNQNVSKGFCEKTSSGFYVTPEGIEEVNQ